MDRDEKERNLIELLPTIRRAAFRVSSRLMVNHDDALQEALVAAWVALDDFDESRGCKVWTYLSPRVTGAVVDYVRDKTHQFANNRMMKHKRVRSLNVLAIRGDHPVELSDLLEDYRETPQDRVEADEAFEELTGGSVLLHRLYFDDDKIKDVAKQLGWSANWTGKMKARELARVRDRITERADFSKERRRELRER